MYQCFLQFFYPSIFGGQLVHGIYEWCENYKADSLQEAIDLCFDDIKNHYPKLLPRWKEKIQCAEI